LKETLSEQEIHDLRLQSNPRYRWKFFTQQLIAKFDEWNFSKTVDYINSYSGNNPPLYYRRISETKFIVFNHWNFNSKYRDGFDCWLAIYKNEKEIGKKQPHNLQQIILDFRFDRHLPLIEQYLN